jgi:hypothetical protein
MRAFLLLVAALSMQAGREGVPRLEADRYAEQFGMVYRGEILTATFTLRNSSDAAVAIEKITNNCQCIASRFDIGGRSFGKDELAAAKGLGVLKPGEQAVVEVNMRTAAASVPGKETEIRKAVRIHSDDPARKVLELAMTATMISPFSVEPMELDFGVVRRGEGGQVEATLWSDELGEFRVTGAAVQARESLSAKVTRLETKPGQPTAWRLQVTLRPDAPIGAISTNVEITVDHERVREIHLPIKAAVEPSVRFIDNREDAAELLDFGKMAADAPRTIELIVENFDRARPYLLRSAALKDCRPTSDGFVAEVVEVEAGMKYVVKLTAPARVGKSSYFTGELVLTADHIDVPVRRIRFRGWYVASEKGGP